MKRSRQPPLCCCCCSVETTTTMQRLAQRGRNTTSTHSYEKTLQTNRRLSYDTGVFDFRLHVRNDTHEHVASKLAEPASGCQSERSVLREVASSLRTYLLLSSFCAFAIIGGFLLFLWPSLSGDVRVVSILSAASPGSLPQRFGRHVWRSCSRVTLHLFPSLLLVIGVFSTTTNKRAPRLLYNLDYKI